MPKALFSDRDGTINVDSGYVCRREDFSFIPGIFELFSHAQELGYLIIVITNQSGIARGFFSESDYRNVTDYMLDEFAARDIRITDVYHCPLLQGPMRKPAPGMFLAARDKYNLTMANCVSVGDKARDIEAAAAAGCIKNFLYQGNFQPIIQAL